MDEDEHHASLYYTHQAALTHEGEMHHVSLLTRATLPLHITDIYIINGITRITLLLLSPSYIKYKKKKKKKKKKNTRPTQVQPTISFYVFIFLARLVGSCASYEEEASPLGLLRAVV